MVAAVLSGNRNFEGRVNPHVRANYLASPPLVVAYALAGTVDVDLATEPLGTGNGRQARLPARDLAEPGRGAGADPVAVSAATSSWSSTQDVFQGSEAWRRIQAPSGALYRWDERSTYVQEPPFFVGLAAGAGRRSRRSAARAASRSSATR